MSAPALILIDWQQGLRDHAHFGGTRNNPEAEDRAADLLAFWRRKDWPVRHVKHNSTEAKSPLRAGLPGNAFEPFAEPRDGEPVYEKTVNSCFIGTKLERDLKQAGIDTLVMTGLTTSHCVATSVRMAANLGFKVLLVLDACATFPAGLPGGEPFSADIMHWTQMASLSGEFATVVTADFLIEQWS